MLLTTLCIICVLFLILFIPIKGAGSFSYQSPAKRNHEADAVLSRRLLIPGTKEYENYYDNHPHFQEQDDRSRQAPGLLSEKSRYFQASTFAAAKANFQIIDKLNSVTSPSPDSGQSTQVSDADKLSASKKKQRINAKKVTSFITQWLKISGAHDVGFARLEDYHLYSHKGRGPRSGEPVEKLHQHAVAITVEMDHQLMQSAPEGSSVMESSEQYLRSGVLALKLAAFIHELGYDATAHIDGNYEVICPLVAVDAGLGVIGRMGLLMTPSLGPRVRISVVTTNMPVNHSVKKPERTTLQFCHYCKKCAQACPSSAIPEGARKLIDGAERWQINSEKCYHYWTLAGTDCGRCMTVCPFSHSDDWFHRFIRWGIKNNLVFRRLAIKLDDVFYGRKPPIKPMPGWTDILDE